MIEKHFYKKALTIPLYDGYFVIVFSDDLNRVCKISDSDPAQVGYLYGNFFTGFKYRGKQAFAVVFNFWRPGARISLGVLMHEINHAANKLLLCRDIDPSFDNDEAESYLKTWMGDEVEKFMKKCKI